MKSLRRLVIGLSLLTAGLTASRQCAAQTLEDVSGQVKIATSCFTDTSCQVTATNIGGSFLPGPLLLEVVVDDPTSTVTVLGGPDHLLAPVGLEAGGTAVITLVLNNPNKTFFGLRTSVKIPEKLIGTPSISPKLIPAATPTIVTVTVSIARPQSVKSATLQRLNGTQVVDLGPLHDDGLNGDLVAGDGIFTIQLPFNEVSAGAVLLQVGVDLFGQFQFGEILDSSPAFMLIVSANRARTLDPWEIVPSPLTRINLNGIAALSPRNVWTIGSDPHFFIRPLRIDHWDGKGWQNSFSIPGPGNLFSLWATSGEDVWAVGWADITFPSSLVLHWNGSAWRSLPVPSKSTAQDVLHGVSASSATDAWAVGAWTDDRAFNNNNHPLILHWDGSAWSVVPNTPDPVAEIGGSELNGVYAIAPDNMWAVGRQEIYSERVPNGLVLHWDGISWMTLTVHIGSAETIFNAVAAVSDSEVWAVGGTTDLGQFGRPLVVSCTAAGCREISSPLFPDAGYLQSIAVKSPTDVTVAGEAGRDFPSARAFAVNWNGSTWAQIPLPDPLATAPSGFVNVNSIALDSFGNLWAATTGPVLCQRRDSPTGPAGPCQDPVVHFVYLVPSDRTFNPAYKLAIQQAAEAIQPWFAAQTPNMGAKTFRLDPVVDWYQTSHSSDWYATNTNPPGTPPTEGTFDFNVEADGFALTGGRRDDPNNVWVFYIDADPACGEYGGAAAQGAAVLPANDLRGLTQQLLVRKCAGDSIYEGDRNRWIGGLGHELGHAFGLCHGPCQADGRGLCDIAPAMCMQEMRNSIMMDGYAAWPSTSLLPGDQSVLVASPFFYLP